MTGKENAAPKVAAVKTTEKRKDSDGHHAQEDGIGPGDEKRGVAEVGWKLPCACTVLKGEFSAFRRPPYPLGLCFRPCVECSGWSHVGARCAAQSWRRSRTGR
eukprot:COSAG01_NODE_1133_length_11566_cov_25.815819_15_plen_103_part_00